MDREKEEKFVNTFIVKERRDRAYFQLCSRKKRKGFIDKLNHNFEDIFDVRLMKEIKSSDAEEICDILKRAGGTEIGYAISSNEKIDGKEMSLIDALGHAVGYGFATVVICIPEKLAYFEAEQEMGPPPRYLLQK